MSTLPVPPIAWPASMEDERALKERGRQVLAAHRQQHSPHYTTVEAAALQVRGRAVLAAHRQSRPSSSDPGHHGLPSAADAAAPHPTHALNTSATTSADTESVRQSLVEQFNAHMAECEAANKAHWEASMQQHQAEMRSVVMERDAARAEVLELQKQLGGWSNQHQSAVEEHNLDAERLTQMNESLLREVEQWKDQSRRAEDECRILRTLAEELQEAAERREMAMAQLEAQFMAERSLAADREETKQLMEEDAHQLQARLDAQVQRNEVLEEELRQLQLAVPTASPASILATSLPAQASAPPHHNVASANPFAASDDEDVFGGPAVPTMMNAGPSNDQQQRMEELEAELDVVRQQASDVEAAANADRQRMEEELQMAALAQERLQAEVERLSQPQPMQQTVAANPFGDDDDDVFGGPSAPAMMNAGPSNDQQQRIAELEAELDAVRQQASDVEAAANADRRRFEAEMAQLRLATASNPPPLPPANVAVPHSHVNAANPFGDDDDDVFGGPSAPTMMNAGPSNDQQQRIAELEAELDVVRQQASEVEAAANADRQRMEDELQMAALAQERLQAEVERLSQPQPMQQTVAANPFGDDDDDVFGGPSVPTMMNAGPSNDQQQRIAELEAELDAVRQQASDVEAAANADRQRMEEELQMAALAQERLQAEVERLSQPQPTQQTVAANPFGDDDDDVFGGPSVPTMMNAGPSNDQQQRIAELEAELDVVRQQASDVEAAADADRRRFEAEMAQLRLATASNPPPLPPAITAVPHSHVNAANPFGDDDDDEDDVFGGSSSQINPSGAPQCSGDCDVAVPAATPQTTEVDELRRRLEEMERAHDEELLALAEEAADRVEEAVAAERVATEALLQELNHLRSAAAAAASGQLEGSLSVSAVDDVLAPSSPRTCALEASEAVQSRTTPMANTHEADAAAELQELRDRVQAMQHEHEEELISLAEEAAERLETAEREHAERVEALLAERTSCAPRLVSSDLVDSPREEDVLASDVLALQATIARLEAELEHLRTDHAEQLEAIEAEINDQMDERDELLRQRLEEMEHNHQQQEARLRAEVEEQVAQQDAAREAVLSTSAELPPPPPPPPQLMNNSRVQELEEQCERLREELRQQTEPRIDATPPTNEQREGSHEGATGRTLAELRGRMEEMNGHMLSLEQVLEEKDAELVELREARRLAQGQVEHDRQRLTAQLEAKQKEVHELQQHNDELSELLRGGAATVESAFQEQEQQSSLMAKQVQQLQLQLAASAEHLAQRDDSLSHQREVEEALQRRLMELEANLREADARLTSNLHHQQEQQRSHSEREDAAKREQQTLQQGHDAEMSRLERSHVEEVEALRRELDELREELQVAQTVASTVPLEEHRFRHQVDGLRQQLTEALEHNQRLQRELRTSREDLERQRELVRRVVGSSVEVEVDGVPVPGTDARVSALLKRQAELEDRVMELTTRQHALLEEKDEVSIRLTAAMRAGEVREQAAKRVEMELAYHRTQLTSVRDDLSTRIRAHNALSAELDRVQEHHVQLTAAHEELHARASEAEHRAMLAEHVAALMAGKLATIAPAMAAFQAGLLATTAGVMARFHLDHTHVRLRCEAIEHAAAEAMAEGERQSDHFQAVLADAKEEQQEMRRIIEGLEQDLQLASVEMGKAAEEAKALRDEVGATQRRSHQQVFQAQRELQSAAMEAAEASNQYAMLQEELSRATANQAKRLEQHTQSDADLRSELEQARQSARTLEVATTEARAREAEERRHLLARLTAAESSAEEAQAEWRHCRAQLDRIAPRLAQLEEERAHREAELIDASHQLSALTMRSTSTEEVSRKQVQELQTNLHELLRSHASLQSSSTAHEAAAERLRVQLQDAQLELEKIRTRARQHEEELQRQTANVAELEATLAQQTGSLESQLRESERHRHAAEQQLASIHDAHTMIKSQLHQLQGSHDRATEELRQQSDARQDMERQRDRLARSSRERVTQLETSLHALEQNHQELVLQHDDAEREMLACRAECTRLQHHLDDANRHNEMLNHELRGVKESQRTEMADYVSTLATVQKELSACRRLLVEAEARVEDHNLRLDDARSEQSVLREAITAAQTSAQEVGRRHASERKERQQAMDVLQHQHMQLQADARTASAHLRELEAAVHQREEANAMALAELAEAQERLRGAERECEVLRHEAQMIKEQYRRDRGEMQRNLLSAQDAQKDGARTMEDLQMKLGGQLEVLHVSEGHLQREVAELRQELSHVEESLAVVRFEKQALHDTNARLHASIKTLEQELKTLRERQSADVRDVEELRGQLQTAQNALAEAQRSTHLQLMAERTRLEHDRRTACDALEGVLVQERRATSEARAARERALTALDHKSALVEKWEREREGLMEKVRYGQRGAEVLRRELRGMAHTATEAAIRLGVEAEVEEIATAASSPSSAPDSPLEEAAAVADASAVHRVMDELLARLDLFTSAATALEVEDAQVEELRRAVDYHRNLTQHLSEMLRESEAGVVAAMAAGGKPPLPAIAYTSATNNNNLNAATTPSMAATPQRRAPSAAVETPRRDSTTSSPRNVCGRGLNAAHRQLVRRVLHCSSTVLHRVEDHIHTLDHKLRSLLLSMGMAGDGATSSSSSSSPNLRQTSIIAKEKMIVSAVVWELQRLVDSLTREVQRAWQLMMSGNNNNNNNAAEDDGEGSTITNATMSGEEEDAVMRSLREVCVIFSAAEERVLRPFNALLDEFHVNAATDASGVPRTAR